MEVCKHLARGSVAPCTFFLRADPAFPRCVAMPAGRADPRNRSDLEGRAAPQKQVRSRRSKKEVRSGKWGCPRKTGPGPKVRCGPWDDQNGPSFPSMSNLGGIHPQIGPPKCVSHGATTQMDLFFRGRLPKRTSFFQHAQYGTSPLAILYLPIVHGQGTHNKSFCHSIRR